MSIRLAHIRSIPHTLTSWLRLDPDDYKWLALIVGVALVIRIAWVLIFQTPPRSDAAAYDELAWRLVQGQGYVTGDGTPTAFWPVGYPAFLAAIYFIFGYSWTAAGIANALLGTISVALTYRLAREVLCSGLSLVAAGAIALLPSHIISFTSVLRNEALHTVLVLVALIAACYLARHPTFKNATLLGLIMGVGLYVRPIMFIFPAVAMLLIMIRGAKTRTSVGLSGLVLLISLLTISPWTARNYLVMDEFVLTATNGGSNFYKGNGPGADGEGSSLPGNRFSEFTELDWHREGYRLGLEHIANHPDQWLAILPKKFFHLWASDRYNIDPSIIPESYRGIVPALWVIAQVYWMVIVIAATLAAVSRPIRDYWMKFPAILFPLTLLYWTAFHMMFHGEGRFHIQMIPVVIIIAAHLLARDRDWRAWLPEKWRKM